MENASKALLMAASVLIALIILAVLIRTFGTISTFQKAKLSEEEQEQLVAFNEQYTKYLNQYLYGTEVITVINKSLNNTEYPVEVDIRFKEEYRYNGYIQVWRNGQRGWEKTEIKINARETIKINAENENTTDFIDSLGQTDLNTRAFKCTNVEFNSNGRVNKIEFEEKQWGNLY